MTTRFSPAVAGALCVMLLTGCASTSPTTTPNARVYPTNFTNALEAVVDTIEAMRMEIESTTEIDASPFVMIANFTSGSVSRGYIGSESRRHTLTITMERLEDEAVVVRVRSVASGDYTSNRPNPTQTRFITELDRRLAR